MHKQKSHEVGPDGKTWNRNVCSLSISVYEKDLELIEWMSRELGCGKSEIIRTAVRTLATHIVQINARTGTSPASADSINSESSESVRRGPPDHN